jgi:hypothetical protein
MRERASDERWREGGGKRTGAHLPRRHTFVSRRRRHHRFSHPPPHRLSHKIPPPQNLLFQRPSSATRASSASGIRSLLPTSSRYAPEKLNAPPRRPTSAHPLASSANAALGIYGGGGGGGATPWNNRRGGVSSARGSRTATAAFGVMGEGGGEVRRSTAGSGTRVDEQYARPPSTSAPPGGQANAGRGGRFPFRQISASANGAIGGGGVRPSEPVVDPAPPDYSLLGDVELGWARWGGGVQVACGCDP